MPGLVLAVDGAEGSKGMVLKAGSAGAHSTGDMGQFWTDVTQGFCGASTLRKHQNQESLSALFLGELQCCVPLR